MLGIPLIRNLFARLTHIEQKLDHLLTKETKLMTAVDDLNAAITKLAENFVTLDTAIQLEITALNNALASNNTAAIQAAVSNISSVSGKMATDAASLAASVPAPGATGATGA